jgi:hypothetical protein
MVNKTSPIEFACAIMAADEDDKIFCFASFEFSIA